MLLWSRHVNSAVEALSQPASPLWPHSRAHVPGLAMETEIPQIHEIVELEYFQYFQSYCMITVLIEWSQVNSNGL